MREWDEDEPDEDFEDDFDDVEDEEDEPTVPCPYCKRQIHEDAHAAPIASGTFPRKTAPAPRKPWWLWAGVIVCLYLVFRWITG